MAPVPKIGALGPSNPLSCLADSSAVGTMPTIRAVALLAFAGGAMNWMTATVL